MCPHPFINIASMSMCLLSITVVNIYVYGRHVLVKHALAESVTAWDEFKVRLTPKAGETPRT